MLKFRPLRTYLLNHLKHSKFKSYLDSKYEKLIRYIDENYSNPSFKVEYSKKSFKILLMKEFKKMRFDQDNSMINKNYYINSEIMKNITTEKKEVMEKFEKKIKSDEKYKKKDKTNNKYSVLSPENIIFIEDFLKICKNANIESSMN